MTLGEKLRESKAVKQRDQREKALACRRVEKHQRQQLIADMKKHFTSEVNAGETRIEFIINDGVLATWLFYIVSSIEYARNDKDYDLWKSFEKFLGEEDCQVCILVDPSDSYKHAGIVSKITVRLEEKEYATPNLLQRIKKSVTGK